MTRLEADQTGQNRRQVYLTNTASAYTYIHIYCVVCSAYIYRVSEFQFECCCLSVCPDVISMAENPQCKQEEAMEFHRKLRHLLDHCGYTLDTEDEEPSLLIR